MIGNPLLVYKIIQIIDFCPSSSRIQISWLFHWLYWLFT